MLWRATLCAGASITFILVLHRVLRQQRKPVASARSGKLSSRTLFFSCNGLDNIIGDVKTFLWILQSRLRMTGIEPLDFECDHICYRCTSVCEYLQKLDALVPAFGTKMVESMIGGRPIALIKLCKPVCFRTEHGTWTVPCLELPCPKPGHPHLPGLEHAELVCGTEADGVHGDAALRRFAEAHPQLALSKASKEVNSDYSLVLPSIPLNERVGDGEGIPFQRDLVVKFHARPLEEVVAYEVANALVEPVPPAYLAVHAVAEAVRASLVRGDAHDSSLAQLAAGLPSELLQRVCGRITRGSSDAHFSDLHKDGKRTKPLVWVIRSDGIEMLMGGVENGTEAVTGDGGGDLRGTGGGRGGTARERLHRLGFTDDWISAKLTNGERFRLALFPASQAVPATWEGVMLLVGSHYPMVSDKVRAHERALRTWRFEAIQRRAMSGFLRGCTYFEINEASVAGASEDPRFISTARLAARSCEGTLEEVRGWLYFVLGLSELFDGSGYTRAPDGTRMVQEYMMPNRDVEAFGSAFAWVEYLA